MTFPSSAAGPRRLLRVIGLLSLVALLAASCGSTSATNALESAAQSDSPGVGFARSNAAGARLLSRIEAATEEAASARFEASFEVTPAPGAEISDTVSLTASGSYDLPSESFSLTTDLSGLAGLALAEDLGGFDAAFLMAEPVELLVVEQTLHVRGSVLDQFTGGKWLRIDGEHADDADRSSPLGEMESIPDVLEQLEASDVTVEELGREEIRGVDTTHYRLTPTADTPDGSTQPPVDLWLGDDGLVRRALLDLDGAELDELDPESVARGERPSDEISRLVMSIDLFDYGSDTAVTAPAAGDTITLDDLGIGLG